MICKKCSYQFIFDPKKDFIFSTRGLHDSLFLKIIERASARGTYQFTVNQLLSTKNSLKKLLQNDLLLLIPFIFVGIICLSLLGFSYLLTISLALLCGAYFALRARYRRGPGLHNDPWHRFVERWQLAGRPIPGLISSGAVATPPPAWDEPDIHDYGVGGIVLTNRNELVDWLVLNNFHTESNLLVMTVDGYPHYLAQRARHLIQENPDLPIWLLHDPGESASSMRSRSFIPADRATDLGIDDEVMAQLPIVRKRFGTAERHLLPLDVLPYKMLNGALLYSIANDSSLNSVLLGGLALGSTEIEISFG